MQVIGLSGYARSGKDEAAKVLVEEFGFTRVAFADKLREVLYQLNPLVDISRGDVPLQVKRPDGVKRLMLDDDTPSTLPVGIAIDVKMVIDKYGWDGYKETKYVSEIRRLLQRLGTEAGRQTLWDSIWVDAAFASHPEDVKLVIPDTRFPNEAKAIRQRGGQVWRIMRDGVGPANQHASETSLDDYDFDCYTHNDGSLEDFRKSIKRRYLEKVKYL